MLQELKFVQGGVARKSVVPALTHYRIEGGHILAFNGTLALRAPIDLDLDVTPNAGMFYRAVEACEGTVTLHVTPRGKLSVASENMRVYVDCSDEPFPSVEPEGERYELHGGLLPALQTISRFVSDDASRPWSRGVLLAGGCAYATNNIVLVQRWIGQAFPQQVANIPLTAVDEMLRIKEEPMAVQIAPGSATFHYTGDRWLRTQLLTLEWPNVVEILDNADSGDVTELSPDVFDACRKLKPFTDRHGRIFVSPDALSTSQEKDDGATLQAVDLPQSACGAYNVDQFLKLEGSATALDWSRYPAPCVFYGDDLRGVIIGTKV